MSRFNSKNIITMGSFGFSLLASATVLAIASYKIIIKDDNSEMWTGLLTFLVGLYIPSPVSTFVKFTTTGNSVVQQNIQAHTQQDDV